MRLTLLFLTLAASFATPAMAYVNPGLGAGALGMLFGFIAAILLAFAAILYYPIKRFWRKIKSGRTAPSDEGR